MLDRNTVLGITLIMALMFGYVYFTKPSEAEIAAFNKEKDSLRLVELRKDSLAKSSSDSSNVTTDQTVIRTLLRT
ncbi:MAG: hypothetical protein JHD28_08970, partial [Bacteroidia bacterium]|nr:hypothetical protein [Bacteroidia bacterium]